MGSSTPDHTVSHEVQSLADGGTSPTHWRWIQTGELPLASQFMGAFIATNLSCRGYTNAFFVPRHKYGGCTLRGIHNSQFHLTSPLNQMSQELSDLVTTYQTKSVIYLPSDAPCKHTSSMFIQSSEQLCSLRSNEYSFLSLSSYGMLISSSP